MWTPISFNQSIGLLPSTREGTVLSELHSQGDIGTGGVAGAGRSATERAGML
jgi:hypothetical protein